MDLNFVWFYGNEEELYTKAAQVRVAIFVDEQGYLRENELDEQDAESWHIIGFLEGIPVCAARLFTHDTKEYHVGRVAVLAHMRGKKVGLQMMQQVEHKAKELQARTLMLNAQSDKTYFYECCGFSKTGNTSLDEGQPHTEMIKTL